MWHKGLMVILATLCWSSGSQGAELSVAEITMRPDSAGHLVVSGQIDGEATFGWNVMLELIPRTGSRGTLTFTPEPVPAPQQRPTFTIRSAPGRAETVQIDRAQHLGVDVAAVGDVWPDGGTFTAFDTQRSGSNALNGAVDDNGTFITQPVIYSGLLAVFPVIAGADAQGVWDVTLTTDAGASSWEGLPTTLVGATITVAPLACSASRDCRDGDQRTTDICENGTCRNDQKDVVKRAKAVSPTTRKDTRTRSRVSRP